jgi:hypothetical protein
MAQRTIQISLGTAEAASLQHVLTQAQAASVESVGRTDSTLSRIEKKIAKANADAAVKASPQGEPEGDDADA